ncbi:MAG: InlB B-repeat-containing protein [Lachnospiraceae bacterium]
MRKLQEKWIRTSFAFLLVAALCFSSFPVAAQDTSSQNTVQETSAPTDTPIPDDTTEPEETTETTPGTTAPADSATPTAAETPAVTPAEASETETPETTAIPATLEAAEANMSMTDTADDVTYGVIESSSYIGTTYFGQSNLVLSYSNITGNLMEGSLVVKLPVSAQNSKIVITLPIGVEWADRGQNNTNLTSVASVGEITDVPVIQGIYNNTPASNSGKVTYTVNRGVDTITIPFKVRGAGAIAAQTFPNAQITADIYYNGGLQSTSAITRIQLLNNGRLTSGFAYGSSFIASPDVPLSFGTTSYGAVYSIYPNSSNNITGAVHVESLSFTITPKTSTRADTSHLRHWILTNTNTTAFDMTHNAEDGSYTFTRKSNYPTSFNTAFSILLPSAYFAAGDVITAEIQPTVTYYSGVTYTPAANTFTLSIKGDSPQIWVNSSTGGVAVNGTYTSTAANFGTAANTYGALHGYTIGNRGGADSTPQKLTFTFDTERLGYKVFHAIVPTGATRNDIELTILNRETHATRSLTYTGTTTASELITPYKLGLTANEYIQQASYTVSTIPSGYQSTLTTETFLYGSIFEAGSQSTNVTTATTGFTLQVRDDKTLDVNATGTILYTPITSGGLAAAPYKSDAQIITAGSNATLRYEVVTGNRQYGVTINPRIYFYNPSEAVVDISKIVVTDVYGNPIPSSSLTITKLTGSEAKGAKELIVIDTSKITDDRATLMSDYSTSAYRTWRTLYVDIPVTVPASAAGGLYKAMDTFFLEDENASKGWSTENSSSSDPYGLKQTSGAIISGVASKASGYFEIIPKTDMAVTTESKLASASDSTYTSYDGSNPTQLSTESPLTIRTTITNYADAPIKESAIYIPIPKKGDNWGSLQYNNESFAFSMQLTEEVTNPVSDLFSIQYATVTPTDDETALSNQIFEDYNAANKELYNCIRITNIRSIPESAASYEFLTQLALAADLTESSVSAWYPLVYQDLTTGNGAAYKKWSQGSPLGIWASAASTIFYNDPQKGDFLYDDVVYTAASNTFTGLSASPLKSIAVVANEGYEFWGWSASATAEDELIGRTGLPAGALVFPDGEQPNEYYAVYKPKNYTVLYNANGGTAIGQPSRSNVGWYDANLLPLEIPVRAGYTFKGWSLDPTSEKLLTSETRYCELADNPETSSVTLYAIWEPNSYLVQYDLNGGDISVDLPEKSVNWEDADLLPEEAPTRSGYTFVGWNVLSGASEELVTSASRYGDLATNDQVTSITLQAQWEVIETPTVTPTDTPTVTPAPTDTPTVTPTVTPVPTPTTSATPASPTSTPNVTSLPDTTNDSDTQTTPSPQVTDTVAAEETDTSETDADTDLAADADSTRMEQSLLADDTTSGSLAAYIPDAIFAGAFLLLNLGFGVSVFGDVRVICWFNKKRKR